MNDDETAATIPNGGVPRRPVPPVARVGSYILGGPEEADPGAVVFRGTDPFQPPGQREVVVEFFARLTDAEARRRFDLFRAQWVNLEIPGVATAFAAGIVEGHPYVIRRWIDGDTLATLRAGRGALRADEAVRMILPVADALAFAHTRGLIHGNVTAAHLRRDPGGLIFLEGFGSAALREVGDASFGAPVVAGDLAGLATVLLGLVSGERRLGARHGPAASLAAATAAAGRRGVGSWSDLEAILHRAGAREPDRESPPREEETIQVGYGSVAEFAGDLRAWLLDRPLLARPPSASELLRDWAWMHPFYSLAMLGGLLFILALPVGYSWWRQRSLTGAVGENLTQQRRELDYISLLQRAHSALDDGAWERLETVLGSVPPGVISGPELGLLRSWLAVHSQDRLASLGAPVHGLAARAEQSRVLVWNPKGLDVLSVLPGGGRLQVRLPGAMVPLAADLLPDEHRVAVGTAAGVFLVPTVSGESFPLPSPLSGEPTAQLRVSPDGKWIASVPPLPGPPGGKKGTVPTVAETAFWSVNLLPLQEGLRAMSLRLPLAPVVSWSWIEPEPGTVRMAVALTGGEAGSWDLLNTNYVAVLTRAGVGCGAAAWDAMGRTMARVDVLGSLEVFNFSTGERILLRDGFSTKTPMVAMASDGARLAATLANGDVLILQTRDNTTLALLPRRQEAYTALEFVPDGSLITGAQDGTVWRWQPEAQSHQPGVVFTNQLPFVTSRPVVSPDAEWLALPEEWQDELERFVVQRVAQPRDPESLPGQPAGFLGPQTLLVWDRSASRWTAWGMSPLQQLGRGRLVDGEMWNWVSLSADASHLLVRGPGDRLEMFVTASGQRVSGLNEKVDVAAVSGDGKSVAVALADGVGVWTPATGSLRRRAGFTGTTVAISSDGRWAAFGDARGRIRLWRVADPLVDDDLTVGANAVTAMAFAGGDQTLFVATAGSQMQAWNIRTRQQMFRHPLSHSAEWLVMAPNDAGILTGHAAPNDASAGYSWWWPNADFRPASRSVREPASDGTRLPEWFEKSGRRR